MCYEADKTNCLCFSPFFSWFLFLFKFSRQPEVLWAQRSDKIYLTVSLPDAKDVSVKCTPEGLFSFSATGAQGEPFSLSLELFDTIILEVILFFVFSISFLFVLRM